MPASVEQFQTIHTEGAILPPDILQRIAAGELEGLDPATYHLPTGTKTKEAISQSWTRLLRYWKDFQAARKLILPSDETGALATREKWLLPLFQELGYGRLTTSKAPEIDGKLFPIERFWQHIPIHLIGCKLQLDHRTKGARGAATAIPHSMVQEFLNRSDEHQWAFLSNGLQLRLLRDSAALSRQSYVEFDLESMMDGEVYADFAVLWLVCHQSRLEGDKPEDCWLEKWSKLAQEQGTRILEDLRIGVQKAIVALGRGFISHPRNDVLIARLQSGALNTQDYYRQILRIVYRLLFLFVAEDRGLLHPVAPTEEGLRSAYDVACERYDLHYSLRRLRNLAERYRGSKHGDLWYNLSLLFDALGKPEGCPQLALPAFGSFLWSRDAVPDLGGPPQLGVSLSSAPSFIRNEDLLEAILALAFVERNRVLRAVDYRSLGSEELGSVYESLLELHPQVNIPGRSFALNIAAGNERKTTGSFYTPDPLVQCLLDSALEPVVVDAIKGKPSGEAETAILNLKVCDPAVGSGHFLIAAAHRLARHLARTRTGETEPSPQDYQHALRDVIGHCLYGVDLNPMAVELCKISLWMEALEPGKPLGFLDHRILVGNSLLGATPALLSRGIPDAAFEPIDGDDKAYCREFKKQNRDERKGQGMLFGHQPAWEQLGNLAASLTQLDSLPDDTVTDVRTKEQRYAELVRSSAYESGRLLADAWCAAFVWKKTKEFDYPITEKVFRDIVRNPHSITPWMKEGIVRLREQYHFFHWHLAFPDLFSPIAKPDEDDVSGWTGGLDVILGNPPWEQWLLNTEEFFASRIPELAASANTAEQQKQIASLPTDHPVLLELKDAQRKIDGQAQLARRTGRYPYTGGGRVNTYSLFFENGEHLLGGFGRSGLILQSGILTDFSQSGLTTELFEQSRVIDVFDFENGKCAFAARWFPDVHPQTHFCLLTIGGTNVTAPSARVAFSVFDTAECDVPERYLRFSHADLALLSPNTKTLLLFKSTREALIAKQMAARGRFLAVEQQPEAGWAVLFEQHFNASSDSELFVRLEDFEAPAGNLARNPVVIDRGSDFWPLHEGKLGEQYNHRFGTFLDTPPLQRFKKNISAPETPLTKLQDPSHLGVPRYWISKPCAADHGCLDGPKSWYLLFRFSAYPENERTLICWIAPSYPTNHITPRIVLRNRPATDHAFLLGAMNSFATDFYLRRRMSRQGIDFFILKQVPLPDLSLPPHRDMDLSAHIVRGVLELSYTAWDLQPFAKDCGYDGPPFKWDEERRFQIRCELDAAYFHRYGIARDDADYIMETFPIVKSRDEKKYNGDYRTKRVILEIYDAMSEATKTGKPYQTRLDPPPADPRVAHSIRQLAAAQVQRGKAVAYITLLLHAWNKPVAREVLEPSLIFMLNDNLRRAVLGQSAPSQLGARTATGEIVKGLDGLLGAMKANGAVVLEDRQGRQTVRLGGSAGNVDAAPGADRQRAADAVRATQKLGEDRAMSYLDAMPEAEYDLVQ